MTGGQVLANVTCIAIGGRALLVEGPPASGKSSLALALIDRGAVLVGDDAVTLAPRGSALWVSPPPHTEGLLAVANVGIVERAVCTAPLALVLALDPAAARFPLADETRTLCGIAIPALRFAPGDAVQALRAEIALETRGLRFAGGAGQETLGGP